MKYLFTIAALLFLASPALACSPSLEYMKMPLAQKIEGAEVAFIGRVEEATADKVVFRIGAVGHGSAVRGVTMEFKHQSHGTCGELQFVKGEVWLYAGDSPLGPSQRVEDADMDAVFADVVKRLTKAAEEQQ